MIGATPASRLPRLQSGHHDCDRTEHRAPFKLTEGLTSASRRCVFRANTAADPATALSWPQLGEAASLRLIAWEVFVFLRQPHRTFSRRGREQLLARSFPCYASFLGRQRDARASSWS